ncbi:MAG: hypothetical protein JW894_15500 [Bacteroidales bacterium]|nr:hypothetical protein [Bacteroidales bacterium]
MSINITQHFRLEPEAGLIWFKLKIEENEDNEEIDEEEQTTLGYSIGLGAFWMFQREKVSFYLGGRIMHDKAEFERIYIDDTMTDTFIAFKFGPSLGFEYFLVKNFSIGGELSLQYAISSYKYKIHYESYEDEEDAKSDKVLFDTGLFVRVYL